ncbi:hypothetical protein AVEN_233462-1 [Araneus ventricosus]|uniref:Uncharacterized protein n=1 Tax=Araneus ventricosus TaxID=182803 RepID=A0A4Y2LJN0_ARAVE|nr:hypothetical protein AVEN_233462-1 [Araneus ventricosus]
MATLMETVLARGGYQFRSFSGSPFFSLAAWSFSPLHPWELQAWRVVMALRQALTNSDGPAGYSTSGWVKDSARGSSPIPALLAL